jgi:hypothetical protein
MVSESLALKVLTVRDAFSRFLLAVRLLAFRVNATVQEHPSLSTSPFSPEDHVRMADAVLTATVRSRSSQNPDDNSFMPRNISAYAVPAGSSLDKNRQLDQDGELGRPGRKNENQKPKQLKLSRETLKTLTDSSLKRVAGGQTAACPTTTSQNCHLTQGSSYF